MTFNKLGLSEPILRGVRAVGYTVPTEIQARAIPAAISGNDILGRAKTGSGKTAAFILPTLDRLLSGGRCTPRGVRALVLTPTRELAQQVADETFTYGRRLKLKGDAIYGGVPIEAQIRRLQRGLDVLAATPGRLLDLIDRNAIDLSMCETLIVDEADRMFDMGFIADVKRIIGKLPTARQTMLFSATLNQDVRRLASSLMRDPVLVEVGVECNPAESVRQRFLAVEKNQKMDYLASILDDECMSSVLIFSRTKYGADKISRRLDRAGIRAAVIHSNRSQNQRQVALSSFKAGKVRVLVATDIAARGIDVVGISHVINFDTPAFAEDYLHRIGRTGRADASGDAITFVSRDERSALRKIENFIGKRSDVETPAGLPAFVPALSVTVASTGESGGREAARSSSHARSRTRSTNGKAGTKRGYESSAKHRGDNKRKTSSSSSERNGSRTRNGAPLPESKPKHAGTPRRSGKATPSVESQTAEYFDTIFATRSADPAHARSGNSRHGAPRNGRSKQEQRGDGRRNDKRSRGDRRY